MQVFSSFLDLWIFGQWNHDREEPSFLVYKIIPSLNLEFIKILGKWREATV